MFNGLYHLFMMYSNVINHPWLGMVYTSHKSADDRGMVYDIAIPTLHELEQPTNLTKKKRVSFSKSEWVYHGVLLKPHSHSAINGTPDSPNGLLRKGLARSETLWSTFVMWKYQRVTRVMMLVSNIPFKNLILWAAMILSDRWFDSHQRLTET